MLFRSHRAGTALTDDLRRAVEDASGRELGWFFDQWLRRPGYPRVTVRWSRDPSGGLTLRVRQEQDGAPFRLAFPLEIRTGDGRTVRRVVRTDGREATVRMPLDASPEAVAADPDNRVLGPVDANPADGEP